VPILGTMSTQAEHQRPDRGQRVTVDRAQIDRAARPTARTEDIQPRRPGDQRSPDCGRPQHVSPDRQSAIPAVDNSLRLSARRPVSLQLGGNDRLLAPLGYDAELDPALLDIEDGIRRSQCDTIVNAARRAAAPTTAMKIITTLSGEPLAVVQAGGTLRNTLPICGIGDRGAFRRRWRDTARDAGNRPPRPWIAARRGRYTAIVLNWEQRNVDASGGKL
jgi:hypothetical protein